MSLPIDRLSGKRPRVRALAWYFGIPGSGKTTLATQHAAELVRRTGWPVLAINTEEVDQLAGIPDAGSPRRALDAIARGEHAAFIPDGTADVEYALERVHSGGRVIVLVDEAGEWLDAHSRSGWLLRLMRAHRHRHVALLLTTQHLSGDCPQRALSCAPVLHVFRCTSATVLERMERDYLLSRATVQALERGVYLRIEKGFHDQERGQL